MKVLLCLLSGPAHSSNSPVGPSFSSESLGACRIRSDEEGKSNSLLRSLAEPKEGHDQLDYADRSTIVPLTRVDSLQDVLDELNKKAMQAFPDADWLVNLTGGNKLMALAAFQCFAGGKARRFYIEQNQPRTMIFLDTSAPEDSAYKISMSKFLAGYGYELRRTSHSSQELAAQDLALWETARVLAEQATPKDLFDFDRKEHGQAAPREFWCPARDSKN